MGVSVYANNSQYSFDMGYGGFFNLRKNIALALDEEFGKNYALLGKCWTLTQYEENDATANAILARKPLDTRVVDFLYMPDTGGEISHQTCKVISNLLKKADLTGKSFQYATISCNDYEEFIKFLDECYSHHRKMRWC